MILLQMTQHGKYRSSNTDEEFQAIKESVEKLIEVYDNQEELLKAGDCHYCPKGHAHSLINNSEQDLIFYAVVPELKE